MSFVAVAVAAVGAITTGIAASSQNKKIAAAGKSQKEMAALQDKHINEAKDLQISQVADQLKLDTFKQAQQQAQIRGRIRVASAEAGVGMGGSYLALERQSEVDNALNQAILVKNFENTILRIQSDAEAQGLSLQQNLAANLSSLNLQHQNPLLSAFGGAVQGFGTGIQIGQYVTPQQPNVGAHPA